MLELYPLLVPESINAIITLVDNIHWVLVGVAVGMILGVIPGMGGIMALTLLIPFTLGMDSNAAFALFGGALGATSFAGSITAILVNTPGSSSNAATLLDGYPMTKRGEGAKAIGASAMASASGAILAIVLFFLLIPVVIDIVLLFGPSEVFWLVVIGLSVLPLVAGDRPIMGIAVAGLGLIASFTGLAVRTGEYRFIIHPIFVDGIQLVPAVVGLFAIAEMLKIASQKRDQIAGIEELKGSKYDGIKAVIANKWVWLRCSIIGILIGTIPGVGGTVANFVAYGHAVQTSENPGEFGTGRIEGVIASEASNDAKDGGQLFPTLGLGIPGSGSTALLLGGFIVHGIRPGPQMLQEELNLLLVIVFSLLVANILTSIIGLSLTEQIVRITKVPVSILFPIIISVSILAVYISRGTLVDVYVAMGFGLLGILLLYYNISRIPVVLALVLGDLMEENFYIALQLASGEIYEALFVGMLNKILVLLFIITIAYPTIRKRVGG